MLGNRWVHHLVEVCSSRYGRIYTFGLGRNPKAGGLWLGLTGKLFVQSPDVFWYRCHRRNVSCAYYVKAPTNETVQQHIDHLVRGKAYVDHVTVTHPHLTMLHTLCSSLRRTSTGTNGTVVWQRKGNGDYSAFASVPKSATIKEKKQVFKHNCHTFAETVLHFPDDVRIIVDGD